MNNKTIKKHVIWVTCTSEAHKNPFIDHCSVCLPYWREYPTCPDCGHKVKYNQRLNNYFCKYCKKHLLEQDDKYVKIVQNTTSENNSNFDDDSFSY